MPSARVRLGVAAALIVLGALGVAAPVRAETSTAKVVRLDLDQAVQPIAASYVVDGIHAAEQTGASAVLLRIDTPGGLDRSMRQIVGAILGSRVPVVCWVGPNGARAASAGTFILLACHIATMAPGTNVGAAHPVGLRGEVLADKITNDAAAFIRSIAQERGRNVAWAERAVRGSVSASDREALRLDVIDAVVGDTDAALRFTDGRTVDVAGKEKLAQTWPAHVERDPIAFLRGLLGSLVDPNLAFLLLLVGLAGIVMEVLHPGLSIPGVVGLLSLVLALVMLEMLPVRPAGVILILAGAALIVAELYIPGGVAGAAGVACLVLGGLFLCDTRTRAPAS